MRCRPVLLGILAAAGLAVGCAVTPVSPDRAAPSGPGGPQLGPPSVRTVRIATDLMPIFTGARLVVREFSLFEDGSHQMCGDFMGASVGAGEVILTGRLAGGNSANSPSDSAIPVLAGEALRAGTVLLTPAWPTSGLRPCREAPAAEVCSCNARLIMTATVVHP